MYAKLAFLHWTYEDGETLSICHRLPDLLLVPAFCRRLPFPFWLADAPPIPGVVSWAVQWVRSNRVPVDPVDPVDPVA